jgi:hypothetical protein
MAGTLTEGDLVAIGRVVDEKLDPRLEEFENRLMARIDDLDDTLSIQMEYGLQEVRDQLAAVHSKLSGEIAKVKVVADRIDHAQQAELSRNDRQDEDLKRIRKNLHAA